MPHLNSPDTCDVAYNFSPEVQQRLHMPLDEGVSINVRVRNNLAGGGLFTTHDVLFAGAKVISAFPNFGEKALLMLRKALNSSDIPIAFEDVPSPEHIAHFCPDIKKVRASVFVARVAGHEFSLYSPSATNITAQDVLERRLEGAELLPNHSTPVPKRNPHNLHSVQYHVWNQFEAELQERAKNDEIDEFYGTYSVSMEEIVDRFEAEQTRLRALGQIQ